MENEVVSEETNLDSSEDALSVDANLSDIEEYLKAGYTSEDSESSEEEVTDPVEENQETETDENGASEEDDGYYSTEEFMNISDEDIADGKFDSAKLKPGTPAYKFAKGFERAQTKRFTDIADTKRELEAKISALS